VHNGCNVHQVYTNVSEFVIGHCLQFWRKRYSLFHLIVSRDILLRCVRLQHL